MQLSSLYMPSTPEDIQALNAATATYRASLDQQIKEANDAANELRLETETVRETAESERQHLSQVITDYQGQFSTAQENRNRDFAKTQTDSQDKFAALVNDSQVKFTALILESAQKVDDHHKVFDATVAHLQTDYVTAADAILKGIQAKESEVDKVVGVIGNKAVTSGYLQTANYARKTLWLWQGIAVFSMLAVIFVAYHAFIPIVQGTFTWESFAARGILCVAVSVLAVYAASQADRFFEMEHRNRKMALELEAIGPFLAPLPAEMQNEFRKEIGDRSFGREELSINKKIGRSPASVVDMLLKTKESRALVRDVIKDILDRLKR
jgi:hypothetical protein